MEMKEERILLKKNISVGDVVILGQKLILGR
jgi:hypothetical protein